uniref:Tc1-like transposase DDE domain-containing protein n=1 Tax=Anguilla anguilla TaxID=7936 RepID=A0A0E9XBJ7_ANGAN
MFWPGQSQDLKPIENIWSHIKHKLTGTHFSTTHQLSEPINIEWNNIDSSFCKKLSASLPTRLKTFKEIKGKSYPILSYFIYLFNSC